MAPANPLGEQIIGKEAIFGDFGALLGGPNPPKNNQKANKKILQSTTAIRAYAADSIC